MMISKQVMKLIAVKHPSSNFVPQFINGFWRSSKYSLRRQADMRKAAILTGKDPINDVGLPPVPEKQPLRIKPPKGTKAQRTYQQR